MTWRTGRKLGRTVYDGDTLIGLMDSPALAVTVVMAVNGQVARQRFLEVELGRRLDANDAETARLRGEVDRWVKYVKDVETERDQFRAAMDENISLRAEIERLRHCELNDLAAAKAEIERLRALVERLHTEAEVAWKEASKFQEENARLRAALEPTEENLLATENDLDRSLPHVTDRRVMRDILAAIRRRAGLVEP